MNKYNYDNIEDDEHVVPSLGILPIEISDDYKFISNNIILNLFRDILIVPIAIILYLIAKIFLGFKVIDKDNLINDRGVVTVSNHIHYIDCTLIGLITFPKKTYFPTLEENFKIPFVRHIVKFLRGIPIPKSRNGKDKFYKDIVEELNNNVVLHMYPEGSLWPYYEDIRSFKYGSFKIAAMANVPIVPIKFIFVEPRGIYKIYKKKKCIYAKVLPAIYPNQELELKDRISDLKEKAEKEMREG